MQSDVSMDGKYVCNSGNSKEFWGEVVNMQVAEDLKVLLRDIATEKPRPLKEFTMRVEGLKFRLIENWCLCKYCQLFDPANEMYFQTRVGNNSKRNGKNGLLE